MTNMFRDRRPATIRQAAAGFIALASFLPLASSARAQDQTVPVPPATTAPPATAPPAPVALRGPIQAADVAAPKVDRDGKVNARFEQMHESFLKRGKEGKVGLLFLGDSITEGWGKAKDVWTDHYAKYDVANFGISGDRTEHVLWRIDNGELDGISPKVVVLMIGTNDIGHPADDIISADKKIIAEIHQKLPDTKVLVLGIFPRGVDPATNKGVAGMREKIKTVNAALATLDDGSKTRYLDIGDKFLTPEGVLTKEIMPDALHPNHAGYVIWADSMQPTLDSMLK